MAFVTFQLQAEELDDWHWRCTLLAKDRTTYLLLLRPISSGISVLTLQSQYTGKECHRRIARDVDLGLNRRRKVSGLLSESIHGKEGQ